MNALKRMNGWQRLWVVVSIVWLVAILALAAVSTPGTGPDEDDILRFAETVSDEAVRAQLTAAENELLSNPVELAVGKVGGRIVNPYREPNPDSVPLPRISDPDRTSSPPPAGLSVVEFAKRAKQKYPELADKDDDVVVANILARYPVYQADVDPQSLAAASSKYEGQILTQKHVSEIVRSLATAAATHQSQMRMRGIYVLVALIPPCLLYLFGWSIAWVRRGFNGR